MKDNFIIDLRISIMTDASKILHTYTTIHDTVIVTTQCFVHL